MFFNLLDAGTNGSTNGPQTYIVFGVLLVVLIGLFVWQSISNKKKAKQAQEKISALKIGDRVKTIGGICGFVAEINDSENTFVLETGLATKKCYIKFDKAAIYQTAPAENYVSPAPSATVEEVPAETEATKPATEKVEAPAKKTRKKHTEEI